MLDPYTYRVSERLAKSSLPAWQIAQTHNLDHFEKSGFPVRINSVQDIGPLIDTMQENRFDKYMRELGGLTTEEYELVLDASCRAVSFQLKFLPSRRPVVPASTLMSVFCLYKKLLGVNPSFRSVLEIGPGCGYLSFFLQQHDALHNYSQIEACESFYILQNLVNLHCFGEFFAERAFLPLETQLSDYFVTPDAVTEFAPLARVSRDNPKCIHYPWWRIGELISRDVKFEIVTSNANLLEFSPKALGDYLELVHRVMKPDGVFIAQCLGYPSQGTYQSLLDKLWNKGFALLAMPQEDLATPAPQLSKQSDLLGQLAGRSMSSGPVSFTVNNAMLVKAGHPLFEQYRESKNFRFQFIGNDAIVNDVFFARPARRTLYSIEQLVEDTERSFHGKK